MPRRAQPLTEKALAAQVRRAVASGAKKLIAVGGDGADGLLLQVRPNGAAWLLRYVAGTREDGKPWRRDMGLGPYPEISLADARGKARELRKMVRDGIDPIEHKRAQQARRRPAKALTFDEAARRLIAAKEPEWKNAKHAAQWRNTLATYASPVLGKMPVDVIELRHVEDVLAPIWTTKTETATRVRQRIEAVLDWATAGGHRTGDNPARKELIKRRLPAPRKVAKVKPQPALPYADMHRFMAALRQRSGSARALEFAILTAARSGEVRGATWAEIDLDAATWTIPADRMKAGREHVVPLSEQALALLRALPRLGTFALVFPAADGAELSDATLAKCIKLMHEADVKAGGPGFVDPKQLGADGAPRVVVPHGFRSTFRTWAEDCAHYPPNVVEAALAHSLKDKTEAAYNRANLLAKRQRLMQDWADFIDMAPAAGNVASIADARSKKSGSRR